MKGTYNMRNAVLYIAMSLDGYIADKNGKVDWLDGQGDEENVDTYSAFVKDVDTVVMGWNTYHQVVSELSPDEWVYQDLTSYVITHRVQPSTEKIKFVDSDPCDLVRKLKREPGKKIWICGGGKIIHSLMRGGLVEEYHIAVIPTLLGGGIRLFEEMPQEVKLRLTDTRVYNGITELIYIRRSSGLF